MSPKPNATMKNPKKYSIHTLAQPLGFALQHQADSLTRYFEMAEGEQDWEFHGVCSASALHKAQNEIAMLRGQLKGLHHARSTALKRVEDQRDRLIVLLKVTKESYHFPAPHLFPANFSSREVGRAITGKPVRVIVLDEADLLNKLP